MTCTVGIDGTVTERLIKDHFVANRHVEHNKHAT